MSDVDPNRRTITHVIEHATGWDAFVLRWYPRQAAARHIARRLLASSFKAQDPVYINLTFSAPQLPGLYRIVDRAGHVETWDPPVAGGGLAAL